VDSFRGQIVAAVRKHCGLTIHPHLFRHFAAAMILKRHPDAHPLVSQLLGHKDIQTTMTFYVAFESAFAADFFYDKVVRPQRGEAPRSRRRGHR
jgi:integrase